jgi:hypothetical protein
VFVCETQSAEGAATLRPYATPFIRPSRTNHAVGAPLTRSTQPRPSEGMFTAIRPGGSEPDQDDDRQGQRAGLRLAEPDAFRAPGSGSLKHLVGHTNAARLCERAHPCDPRTLYCCAVTGCPHRVRQSGQGILELTSPDLVLLAGEDERISEAAPQKRCVPRSPAGIRAISASPRRPNSRQ